MKIQLRKHCLLAKIDSFLKEQIKNPNVKISHWGDVYVQHRKSWWTDEDLLVVRFISCNGKRYARVYSSMDGYNKIAIRLGKYMETLGEDVVVEVLE